MNMRLIQISSLLLIAGVINASEQKSYEARFYKAQDAEQARAAQNQELQKLYQTEKGAIYKQSNKKWHNCMSELNGNWDERYAFCKEFEEATINALRDLKETTDYDTFRSFAKNVAYRENLASGLKAITITDASYKKWEEELRIKRINDAINSNTIGELAKASDMVLAWAEDITEDEKRAQNELRSIVTKVEAQKRQ